MPAAATGVCSTASTPTTTHVWCAATTTTARMWCTASATTARTSAPTAGRVAWCNHARVPAARNDGCVIASVASGRSNRMAD